MNLYTDEQIESMASGIEGHFGDMLRGLLAERRQAAIKPGVIVYMDGGLIQEVIANQEMKILVIDYDTEGTSMKLCKVDVGDGDTEEALTWLDGDVNAEHVNGRIAKYLATDGKEC